MRARFLVAVAMSLGLFGCSSSTTSPTTSGTLTVMLKDSPFADAKAFLVTFTTVSAHASGGDFKPLPFAAEASARSCDFERLTTPHGFLRKRPVGVSPYPRSVGSRSVGAGDRSAG